MSGPVAATSNQQRFADWNPEEVNVGSIWIGFSLCMIAAQCLRGPYAYAGLCNWGTCMVNLAFQTFFTWTSKYYPGPPKYSGTSQIGSVFCYVRGAFQPFFTCVMKGPPTYMVQSRPHPNGHGRTIIPPRYAQHRRKHRDKFIWRVHLQSWAHHSQSSGCTRNGTG